MKANEAPEKIYLVPFGKPIRQPLPQEGSDADTIWSSRPYANSNAGNIEYTRTDAFIEKACDAYCAICDTKECDGCSECSWVIKFRRQLLKY